jgi:hypothetical protein
MIAVMGTSQKIRPRIAPGPTRFVPFPKDSILRMRVRTGRMFVSLFAMLESRSRVVLGIFMLRARMVMFGLTMMMRCCVVMSGGSVMMLLRGMLQWPRASLANCKPCIADPGFVCRARRCPQFGALSSPASQPAAVDVKGSDAMMLI